MVVVGLDDFDGLSYFVLATWGGAAGHVGLTLPDPRARSRFGVPPKDTGLHQGSILRRVKEGPDGLFRDAFDQDRPAGLGRTSILPS
jgi:hypothetical protein